MILAVILKSQTNNRLKKSLFLIFNKKQAQKKWPPFGSHFSILYALKLVRCLASRFSPFESHV
jgi:hypothetical protein